MSRFELEARACELGMDKSDAQEFEDNDAGKDALVQAAIDFKQGIVRKKRKPAGGADGAGACAPAAAADAVSSTAHVRPTVHLTGFGADIKSAIRDKLERLGVAIVDGDGLAFFPGATHLVAPADFRNRKTVAAQATRKWIVTEKWVTACDAAGRLVPEQTYGIRCSVDTLAGKRFFFAETYNLQHGSGLNNRTSLSKLIVCVGAEVSVSAACSDYTLIGDNATGGPRCLTLEDFFSLAAGSAHTDANTPTEAAAAADAAVPRRAAAAAAPASSPVAAAAAKPTSPTVCPLAPGMSRLLALHDTTSSVSAWKTSTNPMLLKLHGNTTGANDGSSGKKRVFAGKWKDDDNRRLKEITLRLKHVKPAKAKWEQVAKELGTGRSGVSCQTHYSDLFGNSKSKRRRIAAAEESARSNTGSQTPPLPELDGDGEVQQKGDERDTATPIDEEEEASEETGADTALNEVVSTFIAQAKATEGLPWVLEGHGLIGQFAMHHSLEHKEKDDATAEQYVTTTDKETIATVAKAIGCTPKDLVEVNSARKVFQDRHGKCTLTTKSNLQKATWLLQPVAVVLKARVMAVNRGLSILLLLDVSGAYTVRDCVLRADDDAGTYRVTDSDIVELLTANDDGSWNFDGNQGPELKKVDGGSEVDSPSERAHRTGSDETDVNVTSPQSVTSDVGAPTLSPEYGRTSAAAAPPPYQQPEDSDDDDRDEGIAVGAFIRRSFGVGQAGMPRLFLGRIVKKCKGGEEWCVECKRKKKKKQRTEPAAAASGTASCGIHRVLYSDEDKEDFDVLVPKVRQELLRLIVPTGTVADTERESPAPALFRDD